MPQRYRNLLPTVLGDFNNDNRQDIAYVLEKRGLSLNETSR